jgi:hypothetical protein
MKKYLGFIIPSAIVIAGLGSIFANVFLLANGHFDFFVDYTILLSVNPDNFFAMMQSHPQATMNAAHIMVLITILLIVISALILILHKNLTVIQTRVLAFVAALLFFLKPAIWAIFTTIYLSEWISSEEIQQDAFVSFVVGGMPESYKDILSFWTAGLLMVALLAAQIVWTFHLEDKQEVIERRQARERDKATQRTNSAVSKPAPNYSAEIRASSAIASPPQQISEELSSLTKLHESGALTNEEFTAAKKRILGLG